MSTVTIRSPVLAAELPAVDEVVDDSRAGDSIETEDVFPQSVASGDPSEDGVLLWTRIAPEQYEPAQTLRVEVAADESFETRVACRELEPPGVKPTDNYTVRVDLGRLLEPDRFYYYRFGYAGVRSPVGRCRTLPRETASLQSLRVGLLNCQNYQDGYYGAMAHLAAEDVHFVLHLGDYVYEHVEDVSSVEGDRAYSDRHIDLPDGETLPMSLNDFRHIYETYKKDPHLRRLHERHTVIQTWDDHAIADDRYWDYDADAPVFPNHPCGTASEFTRYLTRAGIQAWWEFVPARITYRPDADHIHKSFVLYRSVRVGDLVTLVLTDERQFRSEPLSFTERLLFPWRRRKGSRTMLGEPQREWLRTELDTSETEWTVWANAVLFKSLTLGTRWLTPWSDSWDGYEAERASIVDTLAAVERESRTTVVTLTGDMHVTLATYVRSEGPDARRVAVELMTPSVTTVNVSEKVAEVVAEAVRDGLPSRGAARVVSSLARRAIPALNGDYNFVDCTRFGYSVIEFTPTDCTWRVYRVDKTVNAEDAPRELLYAVRTPAGSYEIERIDPSAEGGRGLTTLRNRARSVDVRVPSLRRVFQTLLGTRK